MRSLDAAWSIAALAIVAFHWRHLHPDFSVQTGQLNADLPFLPVLRSIYERGWIGVDFFFMLSGFIMELVYRDKVSTGSVCAKQFFVLRFSRLYPLHLLTLLVIVAIQVMHAATSGGLLYFPEGSYFDLRHFVLNLFLASQWGLQAGPSFNDPICSVSIEVLLYGAFFLLFSRTRAAPASLVGVSAIGFALFATNAANGLGRGLFCFFIGCLLCRAWRSFGDEKWFGRAVALLFVGTWALAAAVLFHDADGRMSDWLGDAAGRWSHNDLVGAKVAERLRRILFYLTVVLLAYPSLLLALATSELYVARFARPLAAFGKVSYSSYLLHLPLMMLAVLAVLAFGSDVTAIGGLSEEVLFVLFFLLLVTLSFLSHDRFEMPVQKKLRGLLLSRRARG